MLVSNFPIYEGPNYAPTQPLMELYEVENPKQDDLCSQIRAKYEELNKRGEGVIRAIAETAYAISSFIQGKQVWQRNWYNGGTWELASPDKGANPNLTRSFNKMQFQVSQMLESLISSNPDYEPADMFKSYEHEKNVKAAQAIWRHYENKFYTPWFNNQQAQSLITTGTAIEELVYDASLKNVQVFKEIWGEKQVQTDAGGGECFSCGFQGGHDDFYQWDDRNRQKEFQDIGNEAQNGDEQAQAELQSQPLAIMPQCSKCGSFETNVREPQSETFPSVIGLERYDLGDFRLHNLPIQAVRYDVTTRPEDSAYFIDKQYFPINKIKYLFGRNIKIGEQADGDVGLDYLHKMAHIGASIGGARMSYETTKASQKSATLIRMSLSPEEAADIDIPNRDLQTVSGGSLPQGKTLADLSPDRHVTILGFNGLRHIYGIYPTHHKKRISSAFYFTKANSGTGRGAEDLTEIQKRINRIDAQQVAAIDGASPGYAFVEGSVDEKHVKRIGFPNAKVPVRREFFNLTRDVNNFVQQFNPLQVAPQFFAYAQELEKMMQMTSHNVSMSGTVFNADNRTATGARILEATAQSITIPFVQSKAGARQGTIKNLLWNYKTVFASVQRKFTLGMSGNKHFAQVEVTGDNIDPEIEFVVVENSMIPQNFYVRRMDYMAFASAVNQIAPQGGYLMLKQTDPEMLRICSRAFNVDIGNDEYDQITEICRLRMDNAFELAELLEDDAQGYTAQSYPAQTYPVQSYDAQSYDAQTAPADANVNGLGLQGNAANLQANAGDPSLANTNTSPLMNAGSQPLTNEQFPMQNNSESNAGFSPEPASLNTPENILSDILFSSLDIPIRPKEKNHRLKADWFKDFLDTQNGLRLSSTQREVLFEFITRHENAELTAQNADQAAAALGQIAASAPAMAVQTKIGQMAAASAFEPPGQQQEGADSSQQPV